MPIRRKEAVQKRYKAAADALFEALRRSELEQDIAVLENNIGFFARSKNADALVADVRAKIERARADMAAAIEKVKLLDRENQDNNNENK